MTATLMLISTFVVGATVMMTSLIGKSAGNNNVATKQQKFLVSVLEAVSRRTQAQRRTTQPRW